MRRAALPVLVLLAGLALAQHMPGVEEDAAHMPLPGVGQAGPPPPIPDAGQPDAGPPDAGTPDAGPPIILYEFAKPDGSVDLGAPCACSTSPNALLDEQGNPWLYQRYDDDDDNPILTYCMKGGPGLRRAGIANGDLVPCPGADVEESEAGPLGVYVTGNETAAYLLRNLDLTNPLWSAAGSPTLTTGQPGPIMLGAYANTASIIGDTSAVSYEGFEQVTQTYYDSALQCFFQAGTLDAVTVLAGGAYTVVSGLPSGSWLYAVVPIVIGNPSDVVGIYPGGSPGDTGSILYGGCALTNSPNYTRFLPTGAEGQQTAASWVLAPLFSSIHTDNISMSATLERGWMLGDYWPQSLLRAQTEYDDPGGISIQRPILDMSADMACMGSPVAAYSSWTLPASATSRMWCEASGGTLSGGVDGVAQGGSAWSGNVAVEHVVIMPTSTSGAGAIIYDVCLSNAPSRCR